MNKYIHLIKGGQNRLEKDLITVTYQIVIICLLGAVLFLISLLMGCAVPSLIRM